MAKEIKEDLDTKKVLSLTLAKLEKDYGSGVIVNNIVKENPVKVISTGSIGINNATGIGGLPLGKVVEIMGWESSGKSTITLQTIANAQKEGLKCLLIDGEHSFDSKYAKALGVNVEELLICQPDYGEMGYNVAEALIDTGEVNIVVIDSQTSLLPKKVVDGEAGDSALGLHARLMSQVVPKIMNKASINNCLVIFISQYREKIGVMFGNPVTTNGGHALKFYSHMRIEISRSLNSSDKADEVTLTKAKIVKNKLAKPFQTAEFYIKWGEGVDHIKEVIDFAVELNIINKSGSWYSYNNDKLGQGIDSVKQLLIDNPELYEEIKSKLNLS